MHHGRVVVVLLVLEEGRTRAHRRERGLRRHLVRLLLPSRQRMIRINIRVAACRTVTADRAYCVRLEDPAVNMLLT